MKIIFEYEDGSFREVSDLKLIEVNSHDSENWRKVDILLSEMGKFPAYEPPKPALVNKYTIADGNNIGGFIGQRDIIEAEEAIKRLEDKLRIAKLSLEVLKKG